MAESIFFHPKRASGDFSGIKTLNPAPKAKKRLNLTRLLKRASHPSHPLGMTKEKNPRRAVSRFEARLHHGAGEPPSSHSPGKRPPSSPSPEPSASFLRTRFQPGPNLGKSAPKFPPPRFRPPLYIMIGAERRRRNFLLRDYPSPTPPILPRRPLSSPRRGLSSGQNNRFALLFPLKRLLPRLAASLLGSLTKSFFPKARFFFPRGDGVPDGVKGSLFQHVE